MSSLSKVILVFGIPRSASSSCTVNGQSLLIAACCTFNIVRCSACCRPSRTWITFNRFSTTFEAFVPHLYLCCTHCIAPESLLNHRNRFCGGMFKLHTKCDADSLFYSLILNVMTTQYTCSLSSVYHPHWPVQWGHHFSCMCIPVHSPWLPGYIYVA